MEGVPPSAPLHARALLDHSNLHSRHLPQCLANEYLLLLKYVQSSSKVRTKYWYNVLVRMRKSVGGAANFLNIKIFIKFIEDYQNIFSLENLKTMEVVEFWQYTKARNKFDTNSKIEKQNKRNWLKHLF